MGISFWPLNMHNFSINYARVTGLFNELMANWISRGILSTSLQQHIAKHFAKTSERTVTLTTSLHDSSGGKSDNPCCRECLLQICYQPDVICLTSPRRHRERRRRGVISICFRITPSPRSVYLSLCYAMLYTMLHFHIVYTPTYRYRTHAFACLRTEHSFQQVAFRFRERMGARGTHVFPPSRKSQNIHTQT